MELEQIVISEPLGVMRIHDRQGRRLEMRGRYASALIVPQAGRLRFTQNEREIIADAQHPIFVPEGSCYLNECLLELPLHHVAEDILRHRAAADVAVADKKHLCQTRSAS